MLNDTSHHLQFSNPRWLKVLSNAALLLALAIVAQLAAIAVGWKDAQQGAAALALAAFFAALAVWLLTRTEPEKKSKSVLRLAARLTAVTIAILWLLAIFIPHKNIDPLAIAALLATAAQGTLLSLHLRTLAARIPNESIMAHFLNLAYAVPAISLILITAQIFGQTNIKIWRLKEWLFCGITIEAIMALIMLWAVLTLLRFAIELRNCATAGKDIELRKNQKIQQQQAERDAKQKRRR